MWGSLNLAPKGQQVPSAEGGRARAAEVTDRAGGAPLEGPPCPPTCLGTLPVEGDGPRLAQEEETR